MRARGSSSLGGKEEGKENERKIKKKRKKESMKVKMKGTERKLGGEEKGK